jgi:ABC-type lipoprotein export system ATPase subunit
MSEPEKETAGAGPLIEAVGLERTFPDGNVRALRGVSLRVARGESVAITGPSGCGKSTLLHLMGGLDRPTAGEIRFEGTPLTALDLDTFRAQKIGFVFQSFHLLATLSAIENVQVPMFGTPRPRSERARRAGQLLDEVGLSQFRDQYPNRLSGGERQRVAVARALANEPTVLLADEPTGNLDSVNQDEILKLLQRLRRERGLTLVIVTHSPEVAAAADREIRMRDGKIVAG